MTEQLNDRKVYHDMCCLHDNRCSNEPEVVTAEDGGFLVAELEVSDPEMGIHSMGYEYFIADGSANKFCAVSPDKHHHFEDRGKSSLICCHCRKEAECINSD